MYNGGGPSAPALAGLVIYLDLDVLAHYSSGPGTSHTFCLVSEDCRKQK